MTAKLGLSSHNPRAVAAALALLVLVWIVGPHIFSHHGDLAVVAPEPNHHRDPDNNSAGETRGSAAATEDILSFSQAEKFCATHHLDAYNATAEAARDDYAHWPKNKPPPQRRVYDLLLVTATTSADMLELRLASMHRYVDYFLLLEVEAPLREDESSSSSSSSSPSSLLDEIWSTRLEPYHAKLIRHTLSRHAPDVDDHHHRQHQHTAGLNYAAARNALYTRVLPLLTGAQRVQPGDALIVGDVEELVRPVALRAVRHCAIPARTTLRTRGYWYSFAWMKVAGGGATPLAARVREQQQQQQGEFHRGVPERNEWWMHPQATVYRGAETMLPEDLRRRYQGDEYVFGDGGWTCHLCYATIGQTLARMGEHGIIWHDGPRWKAAGRVVHRVMEGIDMYERMNLSHIEANPDIPPYLAVAANAARYRWMLDRGEEPSTAFRDFDANELASYMAKKKEIDAQPDFETTHPDQDFNVDNTRDSNPAVQAGAWRSAEQQAEQMMANADTYVDS